jgi:uncharacterized protein (DUF2235 family)
MSNVLPAGNKQIIICCDGTNNTLTANEHDTNVLKIYAHLAGQQRPEQLLYYDPGVGAPDALPPMTVGDWLRNKIKRLWSLASGRGIYENMAQAYLFLMKHYQPGDQIYLFGFSRGAFTVRCISGMIHLFGVLNPQHETLLPTLLRVYFSDVKTASIFTVFKLCKRMLGIEAAEELRVRQAVADQIRTTFCGGERQLVGVHFIGVWDTVESVGLPGVGPKISSTSSIEHKRIRHVRHALSLDEHRLTYQPRLYMQNNFGDESTQQSMLQLWFPGNHCDVGGGYPQMARTMASKKYQSETLLSDYAYNWMHAQAQRCGLSSTAPMLDFNQKVLVHDSTYSIPWWVMLGLCQRKTRNHIIEKKPQDELEMLRPELAPREAIGSFIHDSVWKQSRDGLPLMMAVLGIVFFSIVFSMSLNDGQFAFHRISNAAGTFFSNLCSLQRDQLFAAWYPDILQDYAAKPLRHITLWFAEFGLIISIAFLAARWLGNHFAKRLGFTLPLQNDLPARLFGNTLALWLGLELLENAVVTIAWCWNWYPLTVLVSLVTVIKCASLAWLLLGGLALHFLPKRVDITSAHS